MLDILVPILQVLRTFNAAATFNSGNEGLIRCAVLVLKHLTLSTKISTAYLQRRRNVELWERGFDPLG